MAPNPSTRATPGSGAKCELLRMAVHGSVPHVDVVRYLAHNLRKD